MMEDSVRKEITHMKLERHEVKFVNKEHNINRQGLISELLTRLYRESHISDSMMLN